jgi:hypothetical protein
MERSPQERVRPVDRSDRAVVRYVPTGMPMPRDQDAALQSHRLAEWATP